MQRIVLNSIQATQRAANLVAQLKPEQVKMELNNE